MFIIDITHNTNVFIVFMKGIIFVEINNQENASTESLQNNNLEGRRNIVVHDSTGSSGVAS